MYLMQCRIIRVMLTFVFIILLEGCNHAPITTKSPLGTSRQGLFLVSPLPTLYSVDVAIIAGRLVRNLGSKSEPMADTKILLANVIFSENGMPIVAAVSEKTSPMAVTDERGTFVFSNVAPGTYGIVVVTPIGSFMLKDEKRGGDLLFTVQSGMVLDLGEICTSLPY